MKQAILFLEQTSSWGGAQRVLDEVLGALASEFEPLVALPEEGPFGAELRRRNIETLTYPLGRYRSGRKPMGEAVLWAARSFYCGLRLALTILRRRIKLVYINGPRCLPAGVIAARLTGRPSLFHLHLTLTRQEDIFIAARAARLVTRIVACSETAAWTLLEADPRLRRAMRVLYNPVRKPMSGRRLALGGSEFGGAIGTSSRVTVGMVGRITPGKGQHHLLQAAARLLARGLDLQLVIVGSPSPDCAADADYQRNLESSARALGLEGKVLWTGYQPDPSPYYARLDALVLPSTFGEGLPLVALEAMQFGVPVIASRMGGIPEIVRDGVNGFLIPPGDEEAIANSLERLLGDPALRARLQTGARATVDERFSPDHFRSAIRGIVEELCPRAPATPAERRAEEIVVKV